MNQQNIQYLTAMGIDVWQERGVSSEADSSKSELTLPMDCIDIYTLEKNGAAVAQIILSPKVTDPATKQLFEKIVAAMKVVPKWVDTISNEGLLTIIMGESLIQNLFLNGESFDDVRGQICETALGKTLFTYHPDQLASDASLKAVAWKDLQIAMASF